MGSAGEALRSASTSNLGGDPASFALHCSRRILQRTAALSSDVIAFNWFTCITLLDYTWCGNTSN